MGPPRIDADNTLLHAIVDNRYAHLAIGGRGRHRTTDEAHDAFRTLVTGCSGVILDNAMAMRGHEFANPGAMDILGDRTVGAMMTDDLAVRSLALLGIDCRALGVATFLLGLPPAMITVDGTDVIAVLRTPERNEGPIRLALEIRLAPDVRWLPHIGMIEVDRRLPETITGAAAGRPLAHIVTHRALDALALRVADAFEDNGGTTIQIAPGGNRMRLDETALETREEKP